MDRYLMYARVVVDKPALGQKQIYTYRVPEHLVESLCPGQLVKIPFGKRLEIGFVESLDAGIIEDLDPLKLKDIDALVSEIVFLGEDEMTTARWLSQEYQSGLSESLKLFIPPGGVGSIGRELSLQGDDEWPERFSVIRDAIVTEGGVMSEARLRDIVGQEEFDSVRTLIKDGLLAERFVHDGLGARAKVRLAAELISRQDPPGKAPAQRRVWDILNQCDGPVLVSELIKSANTTRTTLSSMARSGLIRMASQPVERIPDNVFGVDDYALDFCLSDEQSNAVAMIGEAVKSGGFKRFLLQGVTGSGKTEVYLRLAKIIEELGGSLILLVPEISMTPQIVSRFKQRFEDKVAILHSGLSLGERFDQWEGVRSGRYNIVIGPRSAIFAPMKNLAAIIIDEEHESSYKQGCDPRYSTIAVAGKKAQMLGVPLILGSATPSLEIRHDADTGLTTRLVMPSRPMQSEDAGLPGIEIVDMRRQGEIEPGKTIGKALSRDLDYCLGQGRKALLFLNRRGFSRFLTCNSCGYVAKCDNCDVSMVYHQAPGKKGSLRCHHCDSIKRPPELCPACGQIHLSRGGVAIQQVEAELGYKYKGCDIIRMDADSVGKKGAHAHLLKRFKDSTSAILLGTQMIAKGLDFPDIDVVGVIDADTAINLPDFRAAERSFQMLVQVSGRAGRGERQGKAFIQTRNPDHPAIICAARGDYEGFYRYELEKRRELGYPPFSRLVNIIISGNNESLVIGAADVVGNGLKDMMGDANNEVLGPAPAPIMKLKGRFRYHLIVKSKDDGLVTKLSGFRDKMRRTLTKDDMTMIIDVDPYWLL